MVVNNEVHHINSRLKRHQDSNIQCNSKPKRVVWVWKNLLEKDKNIWRGEKLLWYVYFGYGVQGGGKEAEG